MKGKVFNLLLTVSIIFMAYSCQSITERSDKNSVYRTSRGKVEVIYIHNKQRCQTCERVENDAREAVAELDDHKVIFSTYSLADSDARQLADSIGVAGQTLIVIGHKESFNITTEAFIIAQTKPEQLKSYIQEKIEDAR